MAATAHVSITTALVIAALAGCATTAPSLQPRAPIDGASSFDLAGRFSARRGDEGVSGRFTWSHAGDMDTLTFSTPMGQALARLTGDASGVALELADGRNSRAADWEGLTTQAVGIPIPVRGLRYWVRGSPRPEATYSDERDPSGRVSLLRQDGWEIVYRYSGEETHPRTLRLVYPDVDLRLAIDGGS